VYEQHDLEEQNLLTNLVGRMMDSDGQQLQGNINAETLALKSAAHRESSFGSMLSLMIISAMAINFWNT
jgi:DNA-binding transcriptional regulator LsrR (DeoR family)